MHPERKQVEYSRPRKRDPPIQCPRPGVHVVALSIHTDTHARTLAISTIFSSAQLVSLIDQDTEFS